jgi:hypothetical protein
VLLLDALFPAPRFGFFLQFRQFSQLILHLKSGLRTVEKFGV